MGVMLMLEGIALLKNLFNLTESYVLMLYIPTPHLHRALIQTPPTINVQTHSCQELRLITSQKACRVRNIQRRREPPCWNPGAQDRTSLLRICSALDLCSIRTSD